MNQMHMSDGDLEFALQKSVKNNIYFYYVSLIAFAGLLLFGIAHRDIILYASAIIMFVAAVNFNLAQKADKIRILLIRKK